MNRKVGLTTALLIVLIGVGTVLAEASVGVKKGDWIEYQVAYTGTPTEGHDVTWARMDVQGVQGKSMIVGITVEYSNGTQEGMLTTFDLDTGQLGDDFIIPANLYSGDVFFDENVGNITIRGVEERTYAGAIRTVVYATSARTTYYWDQTTGVLVEGNSKFPEYTMNTTVDKTNIWQPQLFGLDLTVCYTLVIGAAVLVVVVLAFLIVRRKK